MIFLFVFVLIIYLVVILVGKYLIIIRFFFRDFYFNKKKVILIILGFWIYLFMFSVVLLVGWLKYGLEGINVICLVRWDLFLLSD